MLPRVAALQAVKIRWGPSTQACRPGLRNTRPLARKNSRGPITFQDEYRKIRDPLSNLRQDLGEHPQRFIEVRLGVGEGDEACFVG